jgi:succinyl-CoA synthetase beta subunit
VVLDVRDESAVRAAFRAVLTKGAYGPSGQDGGVLVEEMAPPGAEILVAVRTDAVVPALIVGLGGIWTEALDHAAILPLPAAVAEITAALESIPALTGDLDAAAGVASAIADVALQNTLELLECNPVLVHDDGAVVVDATAKEVAP